MRRSPRAAGHEGRSLPASRWRTREAARETRSSCVTTRTVSPARGELGELPDDRLAGDRVEVAGGLVGEQHARPREEGARDGDPLALAAGQPRRGLARLVGEPDVRERLLRGGPELRGAARCRRAGAGRGA